MSAVPTATRPRGGYVLYDARPTTAVSLPARRPHTARLGQAALVATLLATFTAECAVIAVGLSRLFG